ncbi:Type I inositol-3,4-bisphosphate 4-phosphatase [Echinococcus granulosus]|uniref:Type I inositol-3,4-bisphosphate 4-phosphatase n=1 Tax=Echinococcus granulosus TaxID=6210 RepID=W6UD22_ECHGR|nr:Type I inositol-3,4-bisphosphate 4-phosphatase [Echinococcus granulosus]EUB59215.1 Type I inositol-3,4-bisphosphate 4-phosphatase [Echinococcus granulosus]
MVYKEVRNQVLMERIEKIDSDLGPYAATVFATHGLMKFNGEDLGHISAHWNPTFEGILLLRQKSESFFRRSNSFCEHWCRLKGNLLVILQNEGVHSTDLVGIVLLERCSVKFMTNADVQHAFQIEFECGDSPLLFAARSAEEANMWCNHIRMAGLSELSARRLQLREELRQLTGKDPLDPLNSVLASPDSSCPDEFSEAGLELQLSLLDENTSFSRIPELGFKIIVSTKQSDADSPWNVIAETEIRTKDCPTFLKTVKLSSEKFSKTSLIKFSLLEFKDLRSSVHRVIASAQTTAEALCNASTLNLPLIIESKSLNRTSIPEYLLVIQVLNKCSNALDFDHLDTHSQQLRSVCENILTRNYVFPHTLGENMRVVEFMGESRFCFQFPIEYLKSLITQEHLLYDSLLRVGMSNPTLECLRKERLLGMKNVIEFYELCLRSTADHTGPSFKRSTERKCVELDFVPTNLHANRIGLLDLESRLISFHDIISVGAFTCASDKFKTKGLFQTLTSDETHNTCLAEFLNTSPIVASALQSDKHVVGRAFHRLATGAVVVVRMSGDLTELNSRLRPSGQAGVLAQRLEKGMSALVEICKSTSTDAIFLHDLQANYEPLLKSIVELATLDTLTNAKADQSEATSVDRELALREISTASSHLQKVLLRTWERAEECLWREVLSSIAAMASTETASAGMNLHTVSSVWDSIHCRHHAVLCQALTASLTGLALAVTNWTPVEWKQMVRCGVPLHFEGLLSCYGEEVGMLENWAWAIQSLAFCRVVVRPNPSVLKVREEEVEEEEEDEGEDRVPKGRSGSGQGLIQVQILRHNEILLTIPRLTWSQTPPECQARGRIVLSLHPFYFNVGINEQQSLAERLERVNLQSIINTNGLTSLRVYFDKYTRKFGAPKKTPTQQDVCDVLSSLQYALEANKSKSVEVLRLATEVSSALNALRFTSCKSAKDRTGMAVSLEQTRWLMEVEGMHKDSFSPALKCLRSTGLRLSNAEKNVNTRKYSFTRFQVLSFPKAYRPPVGTYSLHIPALP